MEVQDKYKRLMIGQLQGDLNQEEQKELFAWVYGDSRHKNLFYELKDIWDSSRTVGDNYENRQQDEWAKLWNEIEKLEKSSKQKTPFIYNKSVREFIKVAAILIVAFGLSWFVIDKVQQTNYNTINVPYGAKTNITLADGTQVWLNSGTVLKYPSVVKNKDVEVYLEGEAFFDVAHVKKRKFNVKTSTINIQVLGTRFNVKSYEDEGVVETTLERGKISIDGKVGNKVIENPIILKPNQQALLVKGNSSLNVMDINKKEIDKQGKNQMTTEAGSSKHKGVPSLTIAKKVETELYTSWKDNKLVFKSETFDELTQKMERWYDVKIFIHDEKLKTSKYTGTFEEENVEQALQALSMSLPFNYDIDKNRIDIYKTKTELKKNDMPMK